jgi:hypothetical protein
VTVLLHFSFLETIIFFCVKHPSKLSTDDELLQFKIQFPVLMLLNNQKVPKQVPIVGIHISQLVSITTMESVVATTGSLHCEQKTMKTKRCIFTPHINSNLLTLTVFKNFMKFFSSTGVSCLLKHNLKFLDCGESKPLLSDKLDSSFP